MDRKIILELIKKDVDELQLLVEAMRKNPDLDNILLEVTTSRTQTLLSELSLFRAAKGHAEVETKSIPEPIVKNEVEPRLLSGEAEVENAATKHEVEPRLLSGEVEAENAAIKDEAEVEKNTKVTEAETTVVELKNIVVDNKEAEVEIVEPKKEEILTTLEEEIKKPQFLGEQFTKEPSLNERFSDLKQTRASAIGNPVTNLRKAIGLNDRFMYTRELFNNESATFDKTIDALDNAQNIMEAIEYLEQNFKWKKNDTSLKFMDLVKRRHENTASD